MAGQALGGIFPALVNIFVIAMQVASIKQIILGSSIFSKDGDFVWRFPKIICQRSLPGHNIIILSQVSPEDIGFWCFLIAFIFVVLSLVRSQLISLFTIYPLVARLPIALSRPLSFSPSMPGLEGGHS